MIRLSKSVVGELEKQAAARAIEDGYLGMGSFVKEFEEQLSRYLGAKNVICVNSGTAALHLGLMGAGVRTGDEVLVQSLTFVGSFQAITALGAKAVPCEIIPKTCTIDLEDAQKKITAKTKAIMPVHYASRAGDLDGIYKFAKKHGLRVVEDAAHAFGTIYKGRKIGSFGDIICFSFDGIKNITSAEGGAVVTKDKTVAQCVMDARLLGIQRDTEKRYAGQRSWKFDVIHQGYRYHMSNLNAAIGSVQLRRFEKEFKPKRQQLAGQYHEALKDISGIILFPNNYGEIVPHIFPIRVLKGKRDRLGKCLFENEIEYGIHYRPNHLLSYFKGQVGKLPVTEQIYNELISLPLHPDLTRGEQIRVIKCVIDFFK